MKILVTACICTFNRHALLRMAIDSLLSQNISKQTFKIIVVDNSTDIDAAHESLKFYQNNPLINYIIEKRPGLSNARNVGLKSCESEYIAYLDDDAIAADCWLQEVMCGFDSRYGNVGVVGGKVSPIWEVPCPEWLPEELHGLVSVVDWGGEMRVAENHEWFAGANIAYRVDSAIKLGGFELGLGRTGNSGNNLLSNEETRLNELLVADGHVRVYSPNASVKHLVTKERLTQKWIKKRMAWQAVSDCISNPMMAIESSRISRSKILQYKKQVENENGKLPGMQSEASTPHEFLIQTSMIYVNIVQSLIGTHANKQ